MINMPFKESPICFVKRMLIASHAHIRWLIPNRYFAFSVPGGRIFLNLHESPMMMQRAFGIYEPEKFNAVQRLLPRGGTFIDIGGNKGDFALLAAQAAGARGRVVCVEPEPTNADWIRKSIALNSYGNIEVCEVALSDGEGEARLHLGEKSGFHTLLEGAPDRECGSITVKTQTLDSLLSDRRIDHVDLIKIDVEGAEMLVLRGATQTLSQNQNVILLIDIHPVLGVNPDEVLSFLSACGLHTYRMGSEKEAVQPPSPRLTEVLASRDVPQSKFS